MNLFPRTACPMCGCRTQSPGEFLDPDMIVCDRCCEILLPAELVRRATARARTRYMVANHIPSD